MKYIFLLIHFLNFILISPNCVESQNFCKKCNPLTNLCIICSEEDILIPDEKGGCIGSQNCISGKNYCKECDTENQLCHNCEYGLYPDENGGCSYSNQCKISFKGECLECKDNFILLKKNKMCKSILIEDFKNCKIIDYELGVCKNCEIGYYLNSGDKKCIKTKDCFESIFGICITCNPGFYFNKRENRCKEKSGIFTLCRQTIDGEVCDICDSGSYLDQKGICTNTKFCNKSIDGKCVECNSGYYLSANNNICVNTQNCYFGDKDINICLDCNMYYFLDSKDYKCSSNLEENEFKYCLKIENNFCVKCESGYYLGKDSKCSFTQNCEESQDGKCTKCSEKYYLGKDNLCSDVEHCSYSRFNFCRECEEGYYYNVKVKKCFKNNGNKNLENCKYSCIDDENICCECKNNYYLNSQNLCEDNNKNDNFYKCAFLDEKGEWCKKCIDGYYLGSQDKKCTLIDNCKISENENKCSECEDLYCLDEKIGSCIKNDFLNDINKKLYFACKKTNKEGSSCEQCIEGYEVNNEGYCVNLADCEEKNDKKCLKCKSEKGKNGYYYCANEVFGCIEGHFKNCLRCDNLNDLFSCSQCKDGFEIDQYGACIEKKIN